MKKITAAIATLGFVFVAGQASADTAMKDLVGQTVRATSPDGNIMVIAYGADGKSSIDVNNGGFTDTGVYKVNGNGYCATWTKIHDGNVYLIANGDAGAVAARATIPPKS